jgi:hypothetical protein
MLRSVKSSMRDGWIDRDSDEDDSFGGEYRPAKQLKPDHDADTPSGQLKFVFELDELEHNELRAQALLALDEIFVLTFGWPKGQLHQCSLALGIASRANLELKPFSGSIFGIPLENVPGEMQCEVTGLPCAIVEVMRALYQEEALRIVGAFRSDLDHGRVEGYVARIASGAVYSEALKENGLLLMSTLKRYFRDLPCLLISNGAVNLLYQVSRTFTGELRERLLCKLLLAVLPLAHLKALAMLCLLLNAYSRKESLNRMSAEGLAVCWGPLIMNFDANLGQVHELIAVVRDFISKWDAYFLLRL